MKSPLKLFLYILLLMITASNSNLSAQDDGWQDKGSYKLINTKNSPIVELVVSQDSKTILSLHTDKTILYWDFENGQLIDSIKIKAKDSTEIIGSIFLSKDGRTAIVIKGYYPLYNKFAIFDLQSKTYIAESKTSLLDFFNVKQEEYGPKQENLSLDYNFANNKLYCNAITSQGTGIAGELIYYGSGFLGILEIQADSLVKVKQIHDVKGIDYFVHGNYILVISGYYYASYYDWELHVYEDYRGVYMYNNVSDKPIDINTRAPEKIIYADNNNIVIFQYNDSLRFFDLQSRYLVPDIKISIPYSKIESPVYNLINTELNYIALYRDSVFHFYKIKNGKKIDTLISPISIRSFYGFTSDNSLLITSNSNEIVMLKTGNLSSTETIDEVQPELKLYPNPAYDKISLDISDKSFSNPEILDVYGNTLVKLNQEQLASSNPNFDISTLPIGVYFVRVQHHNQILTQNFIKLR